MRASNPNGGEDIVILPTDDERLKLILIPFGSEQPANLFDYIKSTLNRCEINQIETSDYWIPSFKMTYKNNQRNDLYGINVA